jgi:hypothetical protein
MSVLALLFLLAWSNSADNGGKRAVLDGSSGRGNAIWQERRFSSGLVIGMVKSFLINHLFIQHVQWVLAVVVVCGLCSILTRH